MWPRLSKITAFVSLVATFVAFVYQLQQLRKECPAELSLPECIKEIILSSTAKTEYEHDVENTDSEQRIDNFIKKYKDGPYVTRAQERLKVARAWTSIKNTTDPRTLFEFLSNNDDPIFKELAQNSLQGLDDGAWQLAKSAGTREAISRYITTWSVFRGRHLQDGQIKLRELDDDDAWRVASREDSPEAYREYLNHPWTQHAGQAQKRFEELAAAKWEREVKNTDSEEVLERFIDRYKEGSYVTLAQERLQIARAWTSIKNTTDPHVVFDFLSYHRDPIFQKLANDLLQRLDDWAWQAALSAGTGDAVEAYVKIWSAFRPPGRHVEEAKKRLSELGPVEIQDSHESRILIQAPQRSFSWIATA